MNLSADGLNRIKRYESLSLVVYDDQAGLATIGYGHLIKPDESYAEISEEQALDLLARDIEPAVLAVNEALAVDVTQDQFDSLVSFVFNVGAAAWRSSTLLKALNARADNAVIRSSLKRWNKVTVAGQKRTSAGLAARREDEARAWE